MHVYEYYPSEDGQGYYITFIYHEALVAAIKQVPANARSWDPEEKLWYVEGYWFVDACRFLDHVINRETGQTGKWGRERKLSGRTKEAEYNEWKKNLFGGRQARVNPVTTDPVDKAFAELHLLRGAPLKVVEAAYRALAGIHHPDVGGDTRRMQDINLAYEKVKQFAANQ